MARSLDQVLADVTAQSDPQRQTILSQIADLPNQQAAQTSAINAQKDQANEDILSSARQRGLGFSGIPLGEQAKYAATTYAPALANLGTSFNNQKGTLESALSQIGQNDYSTANDIFNQDRNFEEQQRQFNEQQALAKQQAAAQTSSLAGLYGGQQQQPAPQQQKAAPQQQDPTAQAAYNFIKSKAAQGNGALISDFKAALNYYNKTGNNPDFVKLTLYKQLYPDLFGNINFAGQGQINTSAQKATF